MWKKNEKTHGKTLQTPGIWAARHRHVKPALAPWTKSQPRQ
jgi:hypothetical protein